jgi:hypothetical protein
MIFKLLKLTDCSLGISILVAIGAVYYFLALSR